MSKLVQHYQLKGKKNCVGGFVSKIHFDVFFKMLDEIMKKQFLQNIAKYALKKHFVARNVPCH